MQPHGNFTWRGFVVSEEALKAIVQLNDLNGWIDGQRVMLETLSCFKRAGASGVVTYFADHAAELLNS